MLQFQSDCEILIAIQIFESWSCDYSYDYEIDLVIWRYCCYGFFWKFQDISM